MNVYCKNCRNIREFMGGRQCDYSENTYIKTIDYAYERKEYKQYRQRPGQLNYNNDCKWFDDCRIGW